MREEWVRGDAICSEMLSSSSSSGKGSNPAAAGGDSERQPTSSSCSAACWARLLEPDCFFLRYKNYLVVEIWAREEAHFLVWEGWVHSRLRQLVLRVERQLSVRPWPKALFPPRAGEGEEGKGKGNKEGSGAAANGDFLFLFFSSQGEGKGCVPRNKKKELLLLPSLTTFALILQSLLPNIGNGAAGAAAAASAAPVASTEPWRCFYFFGLKKRPLPAQAPGLPPSRAALAAAQPVNLNAPVADFRQQVLNYERWREGMDLSVRHVKAAALPACALEAARRTQAAVEASRARFSSAPEGGGGSGEPAGAGVGAAGAASGVKRDREEEREQEEGGDGGVAAAVAASAAAAAAPASDESPAKRAKDEAKADPAGATADAAAASGDLKAAEAEAGMAAAGDVGEWAGIDAGQG